VSQRQAQSAIEAEPLQIGVLITAQSGFSPGPRSHDEDVVPAFAVLVWTRLVEYRDFFEGARRDADFLLHLTHESVGRALGALAVSADDIPHTGIERAIVRASPEEERIGTNENAARRDPHEAALAHESDAVEVIELAHGRVEREHLEWEALTQRVDTRLTPESFSKFAGEARPDVTMPVHELSP
jgi:hypothetical protein